MVFQIGKCCIKMFTILKTDVSIWPNIISYENVSIGQDHLGLPQVII